MQSVEQIDVPIGHAGVCVGIKKISAVVLRRY